MDTDAPPSLSPGPFGRYGIRALIGRGGMGEVYRAHDPVLSRDVAVKVLPLALVDDAGRRTRLLNEARAAAALNHPNICTIHDVGEIDGRVFVAMELIDGRTLTDVLTAGPLSPAETVRLGLQLTSAIGHAHQRGIVHRDLKSANAIVTGDGLLKVLDFGLAKAPGSSPPGTPADSVAGATTLVGDAATEAGTIVGTVAYMSPEQLRGEPADARSDVWAIGVILQEALTGVRPFDGVSAFDVAGAILNRPARTLPPDTPAQLRAVVSRCLEKEPGRRYQRASEVQAALEAIQNPASTTIAPVPPSRGRTATIVLAAAAVAVITLAYFTWRPANDSTTGDAAIQSLAVLPLTNFSRDPDQDYFADGMTEALIADLAQIRAVRVISRTSVMRFKGTKLGVPEIGRELNVDAVLEGSVQREGSRVLVTTQLIHAATDRHLWAKSYERDMRDVLSLQSEIARSVAGEIRATLSADENSRLAAAKPVDPRLHELYLRGRFHAAKGTEEELERAIQYFEQARDADPTYAPAYAGLADSYYYLADTYRPPSEVLPKSKAAAVTALGLDPALAEARTSLGLAHVYWDWNWEAAESEFKQAIELNPNLAQAHDYYSQLLAALGRADEAIAESRRARELDPFSAYVHGSAGWIHTLLRRYDEAVAFNRKATELEPTFSLPYAQLGIAYALLGRKAEARAAVEKAVAVDDNPLVLAITSGVFALIGERDSATAMLARMSDKKKYVCLYEVGVVHLALNDTDQAFTWFDRGVEARSACLPFAKADPRMDPVRDDPRYAALLRRVGLP
jgi:eukaryotic-like serine/threonine-protein kinase